MLTIGILGQSVPQNLWLLSSASPPVANPNTKIWNGSSWSGLCGDGLITLCNKLNEITGEEIRILPYAVGDTALLAGSAGTAGWWLNPSGSLLANFLSGLSASGGNLDLVMWDQGQRDSIGMNDADWSFGLILLKQKIFTAIGKTIPFLLATTGRYPQPFLGYIRKAQIEAGSLVDYYDLPAADGVHPDVAAMPSYARRWAKSILFMLGYEAKSALGPKLVSGRRAGASIILTAQHNAGSALFCPNSAVNLTGFRVSKDGFASDLAISTAKIKSPITVEIVLSSDLGVACEVHYQWGNADATNYLCSNGNPYGDPYGLPMVPTACPILAA